MTKALQFFLDNLLINKSDIKSIKKITIGFSNHVYHIILNNNKQYKVRIADNNHLIFRDNEIEIISLIKEPNLLFFEKTTGNAIYSWIPGVNLQQEQINLQILKKIINLAQQYHNIQLPKNTKILLHDHFDHQQSAKNQINEIYTKKYQELIKKHHNLPLFLCHNDISLKNLIYSSSLDELNLIDYEWGRINTIYWDFGNFIKESQLSSSNIAILSNLTNLNLSILLDFVFISTYYSLQLSYALPKPETLKEYQKKLNFYLSNYWKLIN